MSAFLTPLNLEMMTGPLEIDGKIIENVPMKNREGRQFWRVLTPFVYQSDVAGKTIIVPDGFISDLASIPRLPFVYRELNGEADMPGVIHDYLYSVGPPPREACDAVLKEACSLIGVSAWKVWAIYTGVRVGGKSHFMRT